MTHRLLIYGMFFLLFADTALGLGIVKNLFLYALCGLLLVDAALKPGGFKFTDLDVHAVLRRVTSVICDARPIGRRILITYVYCFLPLLTTMAFVEIPRRQTIFWMTSGMVLGIVSGWRAVAASPAVAGGVAGPAVRNLADH